MFGSLGGPEIILICIVVLIVFGPRRLPEIGKRVGQVLSELRRATGDLRTSVEREIGIDPVVGLREVGRARRDLISTISEPIADVAKGTLSAVRELPLQVREARGPIEGSGAADATGRLSRRPPPQAEKSAQPPERGPGPAAEGGGPGSVDAAAGAGGVARGSEKAPREAAETTTQRGGDLAPGAPPGEPEG